MAYYYVFKVSGKSENGGEAELAADTRQTKITVDMIKDLERFFDMQKEHFKEMAAEEGLVNMTWGNIEIARVEAGE